MIFLEKENLKIFLLYILFGFGGVWHVLNTFQSLMQMLASPLIIAVSLIFIYDGLHSLVDQYKGRYVLWCFFVILGGWGIEYIGVRTQFPFGSYQYGDVLEPKILQIPLAIGFAWLTICLSSLMITLKISQHFQIKKSHYNYIIPIITAIFMLLFDTFMEIAAPKLDYWTWRDNEIPIQNYLSWFLLGALFSHLWLKLKLPLKCFSTFGLHVYFSQFIYFLLVIFKK
jgi:putative membrane protein